MPRGWARWQGRLRLASPLLSSGSMKRNINRKSLKFAVETIRSLQDLPLAQVVGGVNRSSVPKFSCDAATCNITSNCPD